MSRINLLLLIGSLISLLPSSFAQFDPPVHPCRCDGYYFFQLQQVKICNWNTVDQYYMYMGQDVTFGQFPFGSCTQSFTGPMRCACTHILLWDTVEQIEPSDHFLVYWMPENFGYSPGATLVWEWPLDSECQKRQPTPDPWQYWWQIQEIDYNSNRIGKLQCVIGAKVLPWTSWVPSPVYPPYQPFSAYTVEPSSSTQDATSAQSRSASSTRTRVDLNSTEFLERLRQQMIARHAQSDEAKAAYDALDSDDPRIDKDFVRGMILARNLTRPSRN